MQALKSHLTNWQLQRKLELESRRIELIRDYMDFQSWPKIRRYILNQVQTIDAQIKALT